VPTSPSLFPELDVSSGGCSDWVALEGVAAGGCTRVVLRRALATGDASDRDVTPGTAQPVIWAHGPADAVSYHGASRGVLSLDFETSGPAVQQPAVAGGLCAGCYAIDVKVRNYKVGTQETQYVCQSFEVPDTAGGDAHVVGFHTSIDRPDLVHHMLLFSCAKDATWASFKGKPGQCTSPLGTTCDALLYGWAVGGTANFSLPPEAGIRIGPSSNRFLMLELHYNNRARVKGAVDASAVRLVATKALRQYDAATLIVGDPALGSDDLPKGQQTVHRQGMCSTDCTSSVLAPGESITVVASFKHAHSFARELLSNVYDAQLKFRASLGATDFWNFAFQGFSQLDNPVRIYSGDKIFTSCRYDTRKWPEPVRFGLGSLNEMCMGKRRLDSGCRRARRRC
jgi:hypothetical protein